MTRAHLLRTTSVTGAVAAVALAGFGISPAAAAEKTPASWESNALGLPAAHRSTQGEGVTVAVLDSGINPDHPALKGSVDKIAKDFYDADGLKPGDRKYGEHGTSMVSDVLKVAPKARIISARVTNDEDDDNGSLEDQEEENPVAKGIDWAVANGADVISLSLGGGMFSDFDEREAAAAARAVNKGVVLLASAGNTGGDDEINDGNFPAGYPDVISVAATQPGGTRAEFSTVRAHNTIAAPGVGITSADTSGGYRKVNGTSPATALASGVAALTISKNKDLTPAQTRAILVDTAQHPPGGRNSLVGAGQINAAAAVRAAANPPKAGSAPVAYKGDKKHFAKPTGAKPKLAAPEETGTRTMALVAAGVGLLLAVAGGVLMRRKAG
ncbi:S8 family peptidase [Streptomyces luteolus]|uniref:S8 family serine peptidase n=1 Tax=Streptomyces luteolus TaxID=3043615 RepID=A0ABT6T4A0_9ACTN|nr:S8 family serine peptidase [Streptomyces sp. B-S-A12]MDI3422687.1 S8 family serine peptidase [Streptomyces sp. B-S-A12]